MARYELIITQQQPKCGGKSPTRSEIRTVETPDPIAYVKALEPDAGDPEITRRSDSLQLQFNHNGQWIRYEFTLED